MRSVVACCAVSVLCGSTLLAGPLSPPAGAIVSSGKTLVDVEPRTAITVLNTPGDANSIFKITQPGSYYLTGNLTGANAKHGIEVAADNVTIDLNGFTVQGVAGSFDAIRSDGGAGLTGLTVRNGTITGWTNGSAVYAGSIAQCRAENLVITSVGFEGVWFGNYATVERCEARGTRGGFRVGNRSFVRNCVSELATERGILTGDFSQVSDCTVRQSTQGGIRVLMLCQVERCKVVLAGSVSVEGSSDCTFRWIDVYGGAGPGVYGSARCGFADCSVNSPSGDGIFGQQDSVVERCRIDSANGHGVSVQSGSMVVDSAAKGSTLNGVHTTGNCTVKRCMASFSRGNGIQADHSSTVMDNTCIRSGEGGTGAGIRVIGTGCRVEGNHCTGADFGVQVTGSNNVIVRNTCSGNTTNWSLAANNVFGPILDRISPGSGAVSGNSAADQTGSSHPNANFTH